MATACLQQSIDIAAPPSCIWRSLADEEGLKAFGMKLVHVEMRNGGVIEEGFSPTAKLGGNETIRHRIIAYLPERLLGAAQRGDAAGSAACRALPQCRAGDFHRAPPGRQDALHHFPYRLWAGRRLRPALCVLSER